MTSTLSPHPGGPGFATPELLSSDTTKDHRSPLILIVDDYRDAREMYAICLKFEGFACMTANDGCEALERIRERRPALILMDATMPVMDGWEATRRIRADPLTHDIPLLMLTAHAFAEHRLLAAEVGATGFLTKPILPDQLVVEIRRVLNLGDRLAGGPVICPQ